MNPLFKRELDAYKSSKICIIHETDSRLIFCTLEKIESYVIVRHNIVLSKSNGGYMSQTSILMMTADIKQALDAFKHASKDEVRCAFCGKWMLADTAHMIHAQCCCDNINCMKEAING